MKNIFKLLLIGFIGMSTATYAQNEDQDPKAKKILDALSAKNKQYSSITGTFDNKMVNTIKNINRSKSGSFKLKGDKYKIGIGSNTVFFNGKDAVRYNSEDNEFCYLEDDELEFKPTDFFNIHNTDFKYKYMNTKTVNGKNCDVVFLFPKNPKEKDYQRIEIFVDKASGQILRFVSVARDQTRFIIDLKNLKYNQTLNDSSFNFDEDEHPGAEEC